EVVTRAQALGLPVFPGAVTPTEIMTALDLGLTTLKFFPAGLYGGAAALAALGAPFPQVSFIPTGGVAMTNLADFLALNNVAAVGGSGMVPASAVDRGDAETIRDLCAEAAAAAARLRGSQRRAHSSCAPPTHAAIRRPRWGR
ncbi:MAG: hypothetical protein ACK5KO_10785, partial [Arachnia sp.]